jgi:RNA polymerase sigma-70 factor (ECF subfamily)
MENGPLPPTDWELAHRARAGDDGAFHALVDRHAQALYALAVRLVGNSADAEDVVQETLAGAFRGLRRFRGRSAVKTWLTQILVRQAAQHYRTVRRQRTLRLDQYEQAGATASAQGRSDVRLDVAEAMLSLEPEFRAVIALRELEGMSYEEMAEVLSVPKGTVESRLFRARRQLRELLKEYLP